MLHLPDSLARMIDSVVMEPLCRNLKSGTYSAERMAVIFSDS